MIARLTLLCAVILLAGCANEPAPRTESWTRLDGTPKGPDDEAAFQRAQSQCEFETSQKEVSSPNRPVSTIGAYRRPVGTAPMTGPPQHVFAMCMRDKGWERR